MLVVIPVRAGSKRVDNKALRPFAGGASLLVRAIRRARAAGHDPVVATESLSIAAAARDLDVRVMMREPWTAEDRSPDYTWAQMLPKKFPDERVFAILRITSPFLAASHADRMLELLANESRTSMRCVTPVQQHPGKMWIFAGSGVSGVAVYQGVVETIETVFTPYHSTPTQELPAVYIQTAGLEVTTAETLRKSLAGNRVGLYVVSGPEALDINTPEDWARAEEIAKTWTPS